MTTKTGPAERAAPSSLGAILALVAAAVLWGSNHVVARAAHDVVPLPALIFWRWSIALLLLVPFAWPHLVRERDEIVHSAAPLAWLGAVGIGLFSVLIFTAAYHSLAVEVGLLNATTPLFAVLFAALAGRTVPGSAQAAGLALALLGTLVILTRADPAALVSLRLQFGNVCALLAAMAFAWYSVAVVDRARRITVLSLMSVTAAAATLTVFLPLYAGWLALGGAPLTHGGPQAPFGVAAIVYIALGPTLLANLLWVYGTARLGAARAGGFLYLSPLTSSVLSVGALGEPVQAFHGLGFVLIVGGLVLLNLSRRRGA